MEEHGYPSTVVSVSYHNKNPTKCVGLVQADIIIISNVTCSRHDIPVAEKLLT